MGSDGFFFGRDEDLQECWSLNFVALMESCIEETESNPARARGLDDADPDLSDRDDELMKNALRFATCDCSRKQ